MFRGFPGCSGVFRCLVFRFSGVFRCSGVAGYCSGVPGFSTGQDLC